MIKQKRIMFSAAQNVSNNHESQQDTRIQALEVSGPVSDARVTTVEGKTRHLTADTDHTRHGRRLEATDKITCDSSDSLAASSLEVIAHTLADASLVLQRSPFETSGGVSTILATEALSNTTTLKTNVGASTTTRTVLSVANSTGQVDIGTGAGVLTAKAQTLAVTPTAGYGGVRVLSHDSQEALLLGHTATHATASVQTGGGASISALQIERSSGNVVVPKNLDCGTSFHINTAAGSNNDSLQIVHNGDSFAFISKKTGNAADHQFMQVNRTTGDLSVGSVLSNGNLDCTGTIRANTQFESNNILQRTTDQAFLYINQSNLVNIGNSNNTQSINIFGNVRTPASLLLNTALSNADSAVSLFANAHSGAITLGNTSRAVNINSTTTTVNGNLTVSGDTTIQSSAPTLALVDTDHDSDFRIRLENGHVRFSDTTNFNRDFLVANSSGDCNIGVSGRTTSVMGNSVVNGNLTVAGTTTLTGALSVASSVQIAGSNAVTDASTVSAKLEVWSGSVVKTTAVIGFTPTGAWQNLFSTQYPSLTVPDAQIGDIVEVRGSFVEDHGNNGYANMSSLFQYVVREGSSLGTNIGGASVSVVAGGDNNIENAMGHYYTRATVTTPGSIFVGLVYKAANSVARDLVKCANGSNSSLFVRLRRDFNVPTV